MNIHDGKSYNSWLLQVDYNVSRHLDAELWASDWDVMILHYLGLDHIGHLEGPHSPLIGPKLQEMDEVIHRIYTSLEKQVLRLSNGNHSFSRQNILSQPFFHFDKYDLICQVKCLPAVNSYEISMLIHYGILKKN